MSPPPSTRVSSSGPLDATIMIVGEAPGAEEAKQGKPFVGPAGTVLEQCLHAAGLTRAECYITNVIKVRPKNNDISPYFDKGHFTKLAEGFLAELQEEISRVKPNVVVALGATALAALTGRTGIMTLRGYVMENSDGLKIIPTIHPAASLRGMYIYRYLISADLKKARLESGSPDVRRPERTLVYSYASVREAVEWINKCGESPRLSVDIEVLNYEIAIIGLAPSPELGVAIPLADARWSLDDEVLLWRALAKVLGNPKTTKIFQNGIFDIHFLATKCGIKVRGPIEDTMVAHHIMYPDLQKGLGFLGSLYCGSQAYWKDMIKWDNIKDES